tara:strand:+ start:841 stop:2484 length:1644 start_codon:yes stop_codon:yes gene_type:complete
MSNSDAFGELAWGEIDNLQFIPSALSFLQEDPGALYKFVLRAYPYYLSSEVTSHAFGELAFGDIDQSADVVVVMLSDHDLFDNEVEFDVRLMEAYNFAFSIPLPNDGVTGETAIGKITIANGDMRRDDLTRRQWDGINLELFVGGTFNKSLATEKTFTWPEYQKITDLKCLGIEWTEDKITLAVSAQGAELESHFPCHIYGGTGGVDGNDQVEGQPKPIVFGDVYNYSPKKIADHVYQITTIEAANGTIATLVVRIDGVVQSNAGTTADPFTESASTGEYKTQLSTGLIYIEDDGQVTVDVIMSITDAITIAKNIVSYCSSFDSGRISARGPLSYPIGIVFESDTTIEGALSEICTGMGWFWFFNRDGLLEINEHADPSTDDVDFTINEEDIISGSLERIATPQPVWEHRVAYKKNYSPQDPAAIDATVSEYERQAFSEPFKYVVSQNTITKSQNSRAKQKTLLGFFKNKADAATVSELMLARDRIRKSLYTMQLQRKFMILSPNNVIVVNHSRFSLGYNRGQVLKIEEVAETALTTITVLLTEVAG